MNHIKDLTGKRFGRLVVIEREAANDKFRYSQWRCLCDCGSQTIARSGSLRSGHTTSCGCLRRDNMIKLGYDRKKYDSDSRLYHIWQGMRSRCFNANHKRYMDYGGRGITVCEEWENDFQAFYEWAIANGYDDKLSIDRIDNDKGYSPDNCRWATAKEQNNNKRNVKKERIMTENEKELISSIRENDNPEQAL